MKYIRVICLTVFAAFMFQTGASAQDLYHTYLWEENAKYEPITAAEKKMPSAYLFDKRFVEFVYLAGDDLHCYYTRHKKLHINEGKEVEENNRIYLPVSDERNIVRLKVRVITPAGKVIEHALEDFKEIEENGTTYKILAVEGLEAGAQLEYLCIVRTGLRYWDDERLQQDEFVRSSIFELHAPMNLKFEAKSYNGLPAPKDTNADGKTIIRVVAKNLPAMEKLPYTFKEADRMRLEYKMAYNTKRDNDRLFTWDIAAKRFFEMFHIFTKNEVKAVRKIIETARLKGRDESQTVQNVDNYIKSNIKLQGSNPEEGSDVDIILKNKYGTQVSVTKVFTAFLDELEVPYEFALACDRTEKRFDGSFDSWNYLDRVILYFPKLNKYLYPGDRNYRFGMIPYEYVGTEALYVKTVSVKDAKKGKASIVTIPCNELEENMDTFHCDVRFASNLYDLNLQVRRSMSGYTAQEIRPSYFALKEDARRNLLTEFLKQSTGDGKVSDATAANFNLNSKEREMPFIIEGKVLNSTAVEKAGDKYIVKVGTLIGKQSQLYGEKERTGDVYLHYPHGLYRRFSITIPEGYKLTGIEALKKKLEYASSGESKPDVGFVSDYKLNGNTLEFNINEYYGKLRYPVSAYSHFREIINAAADFNNVTLVLEKK